VARTLRLSGRLLAKSADRPLAGYRVHGQLRGEGRRGVDLGYDLTDQAGRFALSFARRSVPDNAGKAGSAVQAERDEPNVRVSLRIVTPGGKKLAEKIVTWRSDRGKPLTVRVLVPTEDGTLTLRQLAEDASLQLPAELLAALEERGIKRLADLRRAGGPSRLKGLPVAADHPALAALEAHANLSLLSSDARINAQLAKHGYTSPRAIAASSRADFVKRVGEAVGEARAYALHGSSDAQAKFLDSVAAGMEVTLAEGRNGWTAGLDLEVIDPVPCRCRDCEAAVSPLAYLADLLDYARQRLRENGPVTVEALANRFHQPFGRLPAACAALDEQVCQVRICIEVLRGYLAAHPPGALRRNALAAAERDYRRHAYFRLLSVVGMSYDALRLALAADEDTRRRLAERIGVATNHLGIFVLDPGTVAEADLERAFGLRRSDRDPLEAVPISLLERRRLEYLEQIWHGEDWPDDSPPDGQPVIDPDVIGPDDFRSPVAKANPADPDRAFDIWLVRRTWVDDRLGQLLDPANHPQRVVRGAPEPDYLAGMFAILYRPVGYRGLQRQAWDNAVPPDAFDALANVLARGSAARIEQARTVLRDALALSVDAFARLQELRVKDRRRVRQASSEPLTAEDARELASLLVQCMKTRFVDRWRDEEAQAQIEFGPAEFWVPEREPEHGEWPPVRPRPLVDPELVALKDLPGWLAGARAIDIWRARRDALAAIRANLTASRESQGLAAALAQALDDPADPLPDLDLLRTQLNDPNPAVSTPARQIVEGRLYLSLEAFERMMDVRARDAAANNPAAVNPPSPPTDADWMEIDIALTSAQKRYRLYGGWRTLENDPAAPLPYWFALKAALPRWRTDAVRREGWQKALLVRSARPMIDPDVIGPSDFVQPYAGRPAYDLFRAREAELRAFQDGLRQTRLAAASGIAGFDAICRRALGHPSQIFLDFDVVEQEGYDIAPRLGQIGLVRGDHERLLQARRLLDAGQAVLASDWSAIEAALTGARKRRLTTRWRQEERQAGITLRPELFRLTDEDSLVPAELPPGSRHEPRTRREWRAQLLARTEQRADVAAALAALLSAVEEALLPALRDALILATDVPGTEVETKGKALADLLLIETRADGCQTTTRISQAITTVQLAIWSIRTGQLRDTYPALTLDDDDFDERWSWIGSYATWRAAIFVHIYPENILVPALRRSPSPGFDTFLGEVRLARRRINPGNACRFAAIYADYYRDIVSLDIRASCHARTDLSNASCGARSTGGERVLTYWFARAGASGRCYWSRYDPTDASSQSRWTPIPGLDRVVDILGTVPFIDRDRRTMILVFVKVRKEDADRLLVARYGLSAPGWIGEPVELEGPENVTAFHAAVNQHRILADPLHSADDRPRVIFQVDAAVGTQLFEKRLDATGEHWDDDVWTILDNLPWHRRVLAAVPMRAQGTTPYYLFFQDYGWGGTLLYKLYGAPEYPQLTYFDGTPASQGATPAAAGHFLGALVWPHRDQVFAFWRPSAAGGAVHVLSLVPANALPAEPVLDLAGFNDWLFQTTRVSLESFPVLATSTLSGASNLFALLTLPADNPLRASLGDGVYRSMADLEIGRLQAYIEGRAPIPGSDAARAALAAWQLAEDIVRANSAPPTGIADSVRLLFERRFAAAPGPGLALRRLAQGGPASHPSLAGIESLAADAGLPDQLRMELDLALTHADGSGVDVMRGLFAIDGATDLPVSQSLARIAPREGSTIPALGAAEAGVSLLARRDHVRDRFLTHAAETSPNLAYLEEYYYAVPIQLAFELQRNGHYVAALDWFRTVYDYTEPLGPDRKVWYGLVHEEALPNAFARIDDWLLDPLNPHAIAQTRVNTHSRFVLLSLIRCFLAYADDEFTRDSAESLERARVLYLTALELLDAPELQQRLDRCAEVIGTLEISLTDPSRRWPWDQLVGSLSGLGDRPAVERAVDALRNTMMRDEDDDTRLARGRALVDAALAAQPAPPTFSELLDRRQRLQNRIADSLVASEAVAATMSAVGGRVGTDRREALALVASRDGEGPGRSFAWLREPFAPNTAYGALIDRLGGTTTLNPPYVPRLSHQFCVPPNPVVTALRWHAALNLHKLRTCRNIAGLTRQVEPYAAATDTVSGLPVIGTEGQLSLPGAIALRPTPFRYEALIGRAKELVQLAAQIEASMLAAIEKRDAELYQQLKARQDIRLTRAGVRLQDFRVREAQGAVELAELQRDRAQFQLEHFAVLLEEGLLGLEYAALAFMAATAALHVVGAGLHLAAAVAQSGVNLFASRLSSTAAAFSELAAGTSTVASILSTLASYERRRQEWEFQRDLAQFDVRIGNQQVKGAQDHLQVVGLERDSALLQADHAEETAEFLRNKFANDELYDWMSDVLEGVYSFFLQQATATAKLALAQLAFERQEVPPPFIQDDYWEAPGESLVTADGGGNTPERRGLTGSARLLRDIQQLDQFAFETRQRKLELSQVFSLARLAPIEFARFRQTGVLTFATPMELFDRAFPGHYLRQIRRVRLSVIALVPPAAGIRATLTSSRISRIVIGPEIFQTVRIERGPEQVALTSPREATGILDLEPHAELLRPFEGIGVDTLWEFRMPRAANQFDYSTIADVLMTVEYTALASFDLQQQVIRALPSSLSADRPLSFRHQLADQWYDLHNPQLTATPMTVRFRTTRADFAPNLDDLAIQHVTLFFARKDGLAFEVEVEHLRFTLAGASGALGGGASTIEGLISTRRNAPSWTPLRGKAPFGEWELALPNTPPMRARFRQGEIEDILMVVTYAGRTPAWPS
jgi:hypothetical protein